MLATHILSIVSIAETYYWVIFILYQMSLISTIIHFLGIKLVISIYWDSQVTAGLGRW